MLQWAENTEQKIENGEIPLCEMEEADKEANKLERKLKKQRKYLQQQETILQDKMEEIIELCEKSFNTKEEENYLEEAFKLIPEPKTEWNITAFLYLKIGDLWERRKEKEKALRYYEKAYQCKNSDKNGMVLVK